MDAKPTAPANRPQQRRRQLRNYLLQPSVQLRLGFYSILLAIGLAVAVVTILYLQLGELYGAILELTDAGEEVALAVDIALHDAAWWLGLSLAVFVLATIAISILYTHRLVGPTYAFRRHIRALADGQYQVRTHLRRGDAFPEVAEELNRLAEILEAKNGG